MTDVLAPELGTDIPFVDAVRRLAGDGSPGALGAAVEALGEAESAAGVEILVEPDGSRIAGGFFAPAESSVPLPELYAAAPEPKVFGALYRPDPDPALEAELDRRVIDLLTRSRCLLAGTDFTNLHFVRSREGHLLAYSQRSWGALLAEWANAAGWRLGEDDEPWGAPDFCFPSDELLTGYRRWSSTVKRVLRRKTELALEA
ncbi:MAG: hypothetical protein AAGN66_02600 [Acidobacteriota bacterium]